MITLGHCDLNIATHCNNRCVACSHASAFMDRWFMSPEVLARDLAMVKPFLQFRRLQIVGGEPTLHKGVVEMINVAKESGVGESVSVITNGRLLTRMKDEFWQAIDLLQLSAYPTLPEATVEYAKQKCAEFGKPCYVSYFTEFIYQFRKVPSDGSNFSHCHWKHENCFTIHDGHFALCPQSLFFPKEFMGLGQFVDCLPLAGATEETLQAFIDRKEPFNACRICAANQMRVGPWRETKTRDEWIEGGVQP